MHNKSIWHNRFPGLGLRAEMATEWLDRHIHGVALKHEFPVSGARCAAENLLLLVSGPMLEHQLSQEDRGLFLYRLHVGDTCVLSTADPMAIKDNTTGNAAEKALQAIVVPHDTLDELMSDSSEFRAFVFEACSKRIADLSMKIKDCVFQQMRDFTAQPSDRQASVTSAPTGQRAKPIRSRIDPDRRMI